MRRTDAVEGQRPAPARRYRGHDGPDGQMRRTDAVEGQRPAPARRYRGHDATHRQEPTMSDHEQQPAPDRQPVTAKGADALRAYAARQQSNANELAAFLEDVATNGLPAPETTTPWEVVRDRRLAELASQRGHVA
ncbi:hypothetical protein ABCR94_34630 [Streptomyces sp. 21So2-11]|uniref:hypothetical protein n=2 Tax=unclassified Streptomyces TaxID=2593676 RepID=UPI003219F40D